VIARPFLPFALHLFFSVFSLRRIGFLPIVDHRDRRKIQNEKFLHVETPFFGGGSLRAR
jgi:hypothetical protein